MNPSDQLQYQTDVIRDLMTGTATGQLDDPTPCSDWAVRDLMNHLVGGGHFFGAAFSGQMPAGEPDAPAPDLLGDDPAAAWDGAIAAFKAGVDSPGALEREIPMGSTALPGSVVLEMLEFDLLVHGWDLARATGQAYDPPAELVEKAMAAAAMIVTAETRDGDMFGAEISAPDDASPIDRLAAFTGRSLARV